MAQELTFYRERGASSQVATVRYRDMADTMDALHNELENLKSILDLQWDRVLKLRIELVILNADPEVHLQIDQAKMNLEECTKSVAETQSP